jgi:hypothetical protein
LRPAAPHWPLLFWGLAEHSTETLLGSASAWLRSLAVIRAEEDDPQTFEAVFAEVLRRLESLGGDEEMRRKDLLWFVISWALRRRPTAERGGIVELAKASQTHVDLQREVEAMTRTLGQTWEELEREKVVQADLRARKEVLRALLEKRFGPLEHGVLGRIEAATDAERLKAGILQVLEIGAPEELEL